MIQNDLSVPGKVLQNFISTKEYNRFVEFAEACTSYRYIGLCFGEPGVGKSLAAYHYMKWDDSLCNENAVDKVSPERQKTIENCKGIIFTAPVYNTPRIIQTDLTNRTFGYGRILSKVLGETDVHKIIIGSRHSCPLVVIDEADRLTLGSLEEVRSLYDEYTFGLILIGMPGVEKKISRYSQLYSRIGFSHEFKKLTPDEMKFIFPKIWAELGFTYDEKSFPDVEALNTIVRLTGGNFRLIDRMFSQTSRLIKINHLKSITKEVIDAARKCLIIGDN